MEGEELLGCRFELCQFLARDEADHGRREYQQDPRGEKQEENEKHPPCEAELELPVDQPGFPPVGGGGHIRLLLSFLIF